MQLARLQSAAFIGLEAILIDVEVDCTPHDKGAFVIVGLPDSAVRESKDRVMAALRNSGVNLPPLYITVNLAPSDLKKEGTLYDLPIALGILHALGRLPQNLSLQDFLIVGEMGLSGALRPITGALATAILAKEKGKKGVILPEPNQHEASPVSSISIWPITHLKQLVSDVDSSLQFDSLGEGAPFIQEEPLVDFASIRGQFFAKRALEVAAAGGHNLLMMGPPGAGKTMLAKALAGILPPLDLEESLEVSRIYSLAGMLKEGQTLLKRRPFRSPHHTVSYAGLLGGGSPPKPGEVSLAHRGVLFLDELPEFHRSTLEVLRQPLEDRQVTISRSTGSYTFPTLFTCIAAMNPCPCGLMGHPTKPCRDTKTQVDRYRGKISAPLLDRFDMQIEVPEVTPQQFLDSTSLESSQVIRNRVEEARARQHRRWGNGHTNAEGDPEKLRGHLTGSVESLLRDAIEGMGLSIRGVTRLLKVSQTIADLAGSDSIDDAHLLEALSFRRL